MDNHFLTGDSWPSLQPFSPSPQTSSPITHNNNHPLLPLQNLTSAAAPSIESDNLRHALLQTTMELETTRAAAQQQLQQLHHQTLHISRLLEAATRERDDARNALLLLLAQSNIPSPPKHTPNSAAPTADDERVKGNQLVMVVAEDAVEQVAKNRDLPEKGRLVETVMAAGPLLQTLMLAGPLPQWRHPPTELRSSDIPPVDISGLGSGKSSWNFSRSSSSESGLSNSSGGFGLGGDDYYS